MIGRVARLALPVLALGCILTGGTIALSRLLPDSPNRLLVGGNPCVLPCFYDIVPGETIHDEAAHALERHFDAVLVDGTLVTFPLTKPGGMTAIASLSFEADSTLGAMFVAAVAPVAGLGQFSDLLLTGQRPSHVYRTCDGVYPIRFLITFGADDRVLAELYAVDALTPETTVTVLDISAPGSRSLDDARTSFGCTVETGWHGFAPMWRYAPIQQRS